MTQAVCTFCSIISGQIDAALVFEDDATVAFLDRRPLFHGHTLVVPRKHAETLADVPGELLPRLFSSVQMVSRAVEEGLGAQGTFVAINNRVSQSVPHLHVHVVPRHYQDGLKGFFWPRKTYADQAAMESTARKLRDAIGG